MPPYPLTSFQIQWGYQKEPKFHGIYSRNNLPETKDGTFVINIDEFKSTGTNFIALKYEIISYIYHIFIRN